MKTGGLMFASLLLCGSALADVPSSINNDDSCDVKVGPAATLLLPYFEVNTNPIVQGQTTLFTITNVTRYPQIAHVTLWTDWAFPVLSFNLFLTGYDVQAINLYDVIVRGTIAPPSGTTPATTPGVLSAAGGNLRATLDCASNPALLPASITTAVRTSLTTGVYNPGGPGNACSTAGGVHANAIGYATIDVVANCTNLLPTNPAYYTTDLLFDNVLIGDYQQLGGSAAGTGPTSAFDAAGNPMVHIRAVPEGGGAGANVATGLPYTFYDRYTPTATRTIDRRQPLPSTFAARFIQGGTGAFATNVIIWREGVTGAGASCAATVNNGVINIVERIRFDEHENPYTFSNRAICCEPQSERSAPQESIPGTSNVSQPTPTPLMPFGPAPPPLQATSATNTASSTFPTLSGTDVGGWLYLNLNNGGAPSYSVTNHSSGTTTSAPTVFGTPRASQNWVTVSMFGNAGPNRLATEFDASPLGNGCTPAAPLNGGFSSGPPIGPGGGVFVCPPGTTLTNGTTTLCTGTNVNPNP